MPVSELVRREVIARYPSEPAAEVLALFEGTELPFLERPSRERDRVQLAVLLLADGDVHKLREELELAAIDWRDVLMAAGLGHENWPDVLRRAGFPVP
jgi:hypothetical protein